METPAKAGEAPITVLTVRDRKGKIIKISRRMSEAIHRGLPPNAGQGEYWRILVNSGGASYPPGPTATPPAACQRHGDRGRLYPFYYVEIKPGRHGAYRCCFDCVQELRLQRKNEFESWCGEGADESDGSHTGTVIEELAVLGVELEELPLQSESVESLKAEIARHDAAHPPVNPKPYRATG